MKMILPIYEHEDHTFDLLFSPIQSSPIIVVVALVGALPIMPTRLEGEAKSDIGNGMHSAHYAHSYLVYGVRCCDLMQTGSFDCCLDCDGIWTAATCMCCALCVPFHLDRVLVRVAASSERPYRDSIHAKVHRWRKPSSFHENSPDILCAIIRYLQVLVEHARHHP